MWFFHWKRKEMRAKGWEKQKERKKSERKKGRGHKWRQKERNKERDKDGERERHSSIRERQRKVAHDWYRLFPILLNFIRARNYFAT